MGKDLKNKVDSIRRTLKNNALEVSGTVIESKILELYPNYKTDWSSDVRAEVIKAITQDQQSTEIVSAMSAPVNYPSPVQEPLTQHQESEIFAQEETEDEEVNTMPIAVNYAPPEINNSQSLAVTNADKQALVSTQSLALGFELSEQECLVVADSVDDVFNDYASFLTSVTSAIRGYVDHRFDQVESALDTNADAVRTHIADRATRLNQKVENFSTNVKADIGGIRQNIKSSKANILSRFALPSKAG
ncbi:hypothetical protein ANSO36C_68340 (plasmid) [Nostoc cf. commune SO-36]|uniref:Uncharacterized protein n=1 Tax=Nostoc cf. commune SO-36 TaxID=449208 RepID=A0ABM7ZCI6_NOSCO|nr:hypothetical protein [Nostoc commune]BDI21032.1 hypothetical protein ANSO36C_68340 [Nostoc cf. commune SO-36]